MISSIQDIQELVRAGFTDWRKYGEVYTNEDDDLILFCYLPSAAFEGRWNYFERVSRGLILEKGTGRVVARGFDKFFNYGENGRLPSDTTSILTCLDKIDGSLGIVFKYNGVIRVATKGSLQSDQAKWAMEKLKDWDWPFDRWFGDGSTCLLVEIVYPENRIVVDYDGFEGFYLLAYRNMIDTVDNIGFICPVVEGVEEMFRTPVRFDFKRIEEVQEYVESRGPNFEGVVCHFCDGTTFKFKSEEYCRIHRLLDSVSPKNVKQDMFNEVQDDTIGILPDHLKGQYSAVVQDLTSKVLDFEKAVMMVYDGVRDIEDQKEFALKVTKDHKEYSGYLFALRNGKITPANIQKVILQKEF